MPPDLLCLQAGMESGQCPGRPKTCFPTSEAWKRLHFNFPNRVLVAACGIFCCGIQTFHWHVGSSFLTGIELKPPALGVWSLRHWTTKESPKRTLAFTDWNMKPLELVWQRSDMLWHACKKKITLADVWRNARVDKLGDYCNTSGERSWGIWQSGSCQGREKWR